MTSKEFLKYFFIGFIGAISPKKLKIYNMETKNATEDLDKVGEYCKLSFTKLKNIYERN